MDRISDLPNELILHIGLFLSAKEAAFTNVLSKRWQNIIPIVQDLSFDGSVSGEGTSKDFIDFVDGVLALPASSRVRNLSIKWRCVPFDVYGDVNRCLCDVLKRGVFVLELKTVVEEEYSLPLEVFTCKTVEKLTLGFGFVIDSLPDNAFLPALKMLLLDSIRFYGFGGSCTFATLLSVSPLLEELVIEGIEWERWKWSCIVSSSTLRRLTIRREVWQHYAYDSDDVDEIIRLDGRGLAYDFDSVSFDLPGLTYLDYYDYVPIEYPNVNLNSLVEAKLDLCVHEDCVWDEVTAEGFNPTNLINGLRNAEILDLNFETMKMFGVFHEAIPVFENLSRLNVRLHTYCWSPLILLIKNSPNLKTLIIEGALHYGLGGKKLVCECVSEYSFLLYCPVEVLEITEYDGSIKELEQLKHLLAKLPCLKLVEISSQVPNDKEMQVLADLLKLPRASSACKLKIKFD